MKIVHTNADLQKSLSTLPRPLAVVMTMGALHEGHLDLVRAAKKRAKSVVVTVFVNPIQFAPGEDFDAYPRTLDADAAAVEPLGVDVVYAPSPADMYPEGDTRVRIDPGAMGHVFEGAIRPTHFSGVLTVVHKFLGRVQPDFAFFGQKDAQQLALVSRMVGDLDLPVEIVPVPITRDIDGLALSSRNRYLSRDERASVLALPRCVARAVAASAAGCSAGEIRRQAWTELASAIGRQSIADMLGVAIKPGVACVMPNVPFDVDYADIVNPATFDIVPDDFRGQALFIAAVRVGTTREIDNSPITIA